MAASEVSRSELTAQNWFERGYNATDPDAKIRYYTDAIRLDPNFVEAYNNRGRSYMDKREFDSAVADFTEAIRIDPDFAEAYNNRGDSYVSKEDYHAAKENYGKAQRLDPDN